MKNYHDPHHPENPDPAHIVPRLFGWKAWAFIIAISTLAISCQLAGL